MSSLLSGTRQVSPNSGYFIPIGDCRAKVLSYDGASLLQIASWASSGYANAAIPSSLQAGACILRDMGRTVVSSNRTFRKVQLVVSTATGASTFGVQGKQGTSPAEDYYTGYIELGFNGAGTPAPVAQFGR